MEECDTGACFTARCEGGACWTVTETEGLVIIESNHPDHGGKAVDTVEAWNKFRDDIIAGHYDHIGVPQN